MPIHRFASLLAGAVLAAAPLALAQEHEHEHHHEAKAAEPELASQAQPLVLPHAREGSGTSWMPDSSPVYAHHFSAGDWMLMLHYSVFAGYDDQWSDRGSRRFTAVNWVMGMASHALAGGELTLRGMFSGEPATMGGAKAFPLLLQSGETYGGEPLHDRPRRGARRRALRRRVGRARARAHRVHAPAVSDERPVPADRTSLAGLDAHHLRRAHRRGLHALAEGGGLALPRARARRGPLELRLRIARFLVCAPVRQPDGADQLPGLLWVPAQPGSGAAGRERPSHHRLGDVCGPHLLRGNDRADGAVGTQRRGRAWVGQRPAGDRRALTIWR